MADVIIVDDADNPAGGLIASSIAASKPKQAMRPAPRIGLVSMTRKPVDLMTWLLYHRERCGIERFYLRIEDTPALEALLREMPWKDCVEAVFATGQRDYFQQMDRQDRHIYDVLPAARTAGLEFLLHIDDDELLYCPSGVNDLHHALSRAPPGASNLKVLNLEAVLPHADVTSPFREVTAFRHRPHEFCAYGNGKSIGRLSDPLLRPAGPHNYSRGSAAAGSKEGGTHELSPTVAVVLHYESSALAMWRHKYTDLLRRHGDRRNRQQVRDRAPSLFYEESMAAMARVAAAHGDADASAAAEADARALFCKWKLAPAPALPTPAGATPIVLRDRGITIIDVFAQPKVSTSQPLPPAHSEAKVDSAAPAAAAAAASGDGAPPPPQLVRACRDGVGGELSALLSLATGDGAPPSEKHASALRDSGVADAAALLRLDPGALDETLRGAKLPIGLRLRVKHAAARVRTAAGIT